MDATQAVVDDAAPSLITTRTRSPVIAGDAFGTSLAPPRDMTALARIRMHDEIALPFGAIDLLELIEPRVRALAAGDLGVEADELDAGVMLADDLAVDSLELTELVVHIEDELGIGVPERAIAQVRTYDDLVIVVLEQVVAAA